LISHSSPSDHSAPLAEKLVPPSDIPTERTPDSGLLMIAAQERLDPTNPEQMRRSRKTAEIMIERAGDPGSERRPSSRSSRSGNRSPHTLARIRRPGVGIIAWSRDS
jgi:hypothetical protein